MKNYNRPFTLTALHHPQHMPGFPFAPDMLDTTRLRNLVPVMLAEVSRFLTPKGLRRGAKLRMRKLCALLHTLYKTERQNYCQSLLKALRQDPEWQAQVKEDLGGCRAMRLWHLRFKRLTTPQIMSVNEGPSKRVSRGSPRKGSPVKTDRLGVFRLASLSRERQPRTRNDAPRPSMTRHIHFGFFDPKPIGITPSDLRPTAPKTSNQPRLVKGQVLQIWRDIQTRLRQWGFDLFLADFDQAVLLGEVKALPKGDPP